jgi:hypothetical protein
MSRREAFLAWLDLASSVISASLKPARNRPARMAIVAGTAPLSATVRSLMSAVSRFSGNGRP